MNLHVPVVGILRGVNDLTFGEILEASFRAGLQAIEITMNTPDAGQMVERRRSTVPEGKFLGMGTVRNLEEARAALDAGAMFIVTPNMDPTVIEYARSRNVPVIAGALTPTEVYSAWSAGADMVKVFPCRGLGGPEYIRELRGPFESIPLVAVGGVSSENVHAYFEAGAAAVGVSTSLFGRQALEGKQMDQLAENVRNFLTRCQKEKNSVY